VLSKGPLTDAIVGAVIASHDQIVCAAFPSSTGNDGVFGTAGNPAPEALRHRQNDRHDACHRRSVHSHQPMAGGR